MRVGVAVLERRPGDAGVDDRPEARAARWMLGRTVARVLQGGSCHDETMLVCGELVELAVDQLRPPIGVRLARHHLADLGQRESDVPQEQHDADGAYCRFRIAALAGRSYLRADEPELVVVAERGDGNAGARRQLTDRQQTIRHLTSSVLEVVELDR